MGVGGGATMHAPWSGILLTRQDPREQCYRTALETVPWHRHQGFHKPGSKALQREAASYLSGYNAQAVHCSSIAREFSVYPILGRRPIIESPGETGDSDTQIEAKHQNLLQEEP